MLQGKIPPVPDIKFKGVYTALITPFTLDGSQVDYEAFAALVDDQIKAKVDGLVPIGTTGEAPTLTDEEKEKLIKICVDKAKAAPYPCQVIAGTGTNCTRTTVANCQKAKALGVDAVLVVNPYYNKPNKEGMLGHLRKVNEVGVPIMLYNIPGRTGLELSAQQIHELYMSCRNIVAIKEASGKVDLSLDLASRCDIQILSGDDNLTLPIMSVGGKGVVSVLSNMFPDAVKDIVSDDKAKGLRAAKNYSEVTKTMFCETNPVPIKYAMYTIRMLKNCTVRLPLGELSQESKTRIGEVMKRIGYPLQS